MAKILIVEDDPDIRTLLATRLKEAGYESAFASEAVTALAIARKEQPDLILLDFGLPGGTALVVLERMRSIASLASVPVIVVSARDPATHEEPVVAAGARAFVRKPIDFDELLTAVRSALGED
jgi:two-component system, OmpR family, phosphate regulon response regulator PhoB